MPLLGDSSEMRIVVQPADLSDPSSCVEGFGYTVGKVSAEGRSVYTVWNNMRPEAWEPIGPLPPTKHRCPVRRARYTCVCGPDPPGSPAILDPGA